MSAKPRKKAPRKRKVPLKTLGVADAVEADLLSLERRDPVLARSGLAASALAMARDLDATSNSATSRAMCARTLLDTLDRIRELTPAEQEEDRLDDLSSRRAVRRARGAGAAG